MLSRNWAFSRTVATIYGYRWLRRSTPESQHHGQDKDWHRYDKAEAENNYADRLDHRSARHRPNLRTGPASGRKSGFDQRNVASEVVCLAGYQQVRAHRKGLPRQSAGICSLHCDRCHRGFRKEVPCFDCSISGCEPGTTMLADQALKRRTHAVPDACEIGRPCADSNRPW